MSRIGNKQIVIPENVTVTIEENNIVTVKGPKGVMKKQFVKEISIKNEGSKLICTRNNDTNKEKALHGLVRSLLNNMVIGVVNGFEKKLEINGVGYSAKKQSKKLILNLGYSHPIEMEEPEGIEVKVEAQIISVLGIDKEKVGQFAAKIREKYKPEPYKGKGIKYVDEYIKRKVGKVGTK